MFWISFIFVNMAPFSSLNLQIFYCYFTYFYRVYCLCGQLCGPSFSLSTFTLIVVTKLRLSGLHSKYSYSQSHLASTMCNHWRKAKILHFGRSSSRNYTVLHQRTGYCYSVSYWQEATDSTEYAVGSSSSEAYLLSFPSGIAGG